MSIRVQVIFYSMYGHVHKMAQAVVEGAKQVPGKLSCPRTRWLR
jgi:NAD(P)H dehydrogenase (quinone)